MAKSEKQLEKHLINDRMEAQLQQLMVINNNISEFKKKLQNEKDKLQPLNLDNLLLIAVEKRMKDFCEVLLLNGGNANHKHKGENEQGLIHYASTNSDSSILEMLVRHGANVEEFDKNGLTPLIYSGIILLLITDFNFNEKIAIIFLMNRYHKKNSFFGFNQMYKVFNKERSKS